MKTHAGVEAWPVFLCYQACHGPTVTIQGVTAALDNNTAVRLEKWLDQKKSLEAQTEDPLSTSGVSPAEAPATAASLAGAARSEHSNTKARDGRGEGESEVERGPVSPPAVVNSVIETDSEEIKMATTIQAQVRFERPLKRVVQGLR